MPIVLLLQLTLAIAAGYTTYRCDAINLGMAEGDYGFWVDLGQPLFYGALVLWGMAVLITGYSAVRASASQRRWRFIAMVFVAAALTPVGYVGIILFLERSWIHAV